MSKLNKKPKRELSLAMAKLKAKNAKKYGEQVPPEVQAVLDKHDKAKLKAMLQKNKAQEDTVNPSKRDRTVKVKDETDQSLAAEAVKHDGHRIDRKPASRKELRQRAKVARKEREIKATRALNRERAIYNKKAKKEPDTRKESIWEKIAEPRLYALLREMGDTDKAIDKFQRKRVVLSLFVGLVAGGIFGILINQWLWLVGLVLGFVIYKMQLKNVDRFYMGWKFQRQLNFSKFTRLVIPYLKASDGKASLYGTFNKILERTEDPADRQSLYQLMVEMADRPQDIEPFLDYAERASGTDMSHLFMSTIYDFQQSAFDTSVIDELGRMASEDMMNAVDEIIHMKLKRFMMFPTKVVMVSLVLVAGFAVSILVDNLKDLGFGDVSNFAANPAGSTETSQDVDTESGNMPSEEAADDLVEEDVEEDAGLAEDATEEEADVPETEEVGPFAACHEMLVDYPHGIPKGQPGYSDNLDYNNNGHACDPDEV